MEVLMPPGMPVLKKQETDPLEDAPPQFSMASKDFQGLLDMLMRETGGSVDLSAFFVPSSEHLEEAGFTLPFGSPSPTKPSLQSHQLCGKLSCAPASNPTTSASAASFDHWGFCGGQPNAFTAGGADAGLMGVVPPGQLAYNLSTDSTATKAGFSPDSFALGVTETATRATKMTPQQRFKIRQKEKHAAMLEQLRQLEEEARLYAARNADLNQRTRVLQKMLELRDNQLALIKTADEPELLNAKGSSSLSSHFLQPQTIKNLTCEEFATHWRSLLGQVSEWLVKAELSPSDEVANHQLNQLVSAVGWLTQHMWLLNWNCMQEALATDLQDLTPAVPNDSHWQQMVTTLQLSDQQKVDICTICEIYTDFLKSWLIDRQLLLGQVCHLSCQGKAMPWADATPELEHTARTAEIIEKLDKLTRRQATAYLLTAGTLFGRVLTPLQTAKACLYSLPFVPDAIATIAVVANHKSTVPEREMMQMSQSSWST